MSPIGTWLRSPTGRGNRVVCGLVGLFASVLGMAVAGTIAMALLAKPPGEQEAMALAEVAVARTAHNLPGPPVRCPDYCMHDWQRGGDGVIVFDAPLYRNQGVDRTIVAYWLTGQEIEAALDEAGSRLAAAGWTIDAEDGSRGVRAHRAGLRMKVSYGSDLATSGGAHPPMHVTVERWPPAGVVVAVVAAGALLGLLAGRAVAVWVLHRFRRHGPRMRTLIVLTGMPVLLGLSLLLQWFAVVELAIFAGGWPPLQAIVLAPASFADLIGQFFSALAGPPALLLLPPLLVLGLAATPVRESPGLTGGRVQA